MDINNNLARRCLVVKFGGSSLADGAKISQAAKVVAQETKNGTSIAVIVSALGSTTDSLINITNEASGGIASGDDIDDVLAMGERTSARIFSTALKAIGVKCRYFDPADADWPIITDGKPANANPILPLCEELVRKCVLPVLERQTVAVIPGFIGKTPDNSVTTMGRGGSDTTAFIVAHALNAKRIILITDVDGIMTADPKLVKSAKKLDSISIESLVGLADSGSKFINKKALRYKDPNIDIKVVHHRHRNLNVEGTTIHGALPQDMRVEVAYPDRTVAVTVVGKALAESPQILNEIIQTARDAGIPILGMSSNGDSVIIYLPQDLSEKILDALHAIVINNAQTLAMAVRKNIAMIKVKGVGLEDTPGVVGRVSEALHSRNINISGIFTITSSLQVFVDTNDIDRALAAIESSIRRT